MAGLLIRVTAEPAWGWCGGLRHPPQAEYPAGALTEAQLTAMRADPSLTVEEIDPDAEARAEAERRAAEAEAKRLADEAQALALPVAAPARPRTRSKAAD